MLTSLSETTSGCDFNIGSDDLMIFSDSGGRRSFGVDCGYWTREKREGVGLGDGLEGASWALNSCSNGLGGVLGDILDASDTLGEITTGQKIRNDRSKVVYRFSFH
jgi:hypothetical protein